MYVYRQMNGCINIEERGRKRASERERAEKWRIRDDRREIDEYIFACFYRGLAFT